MQGGLLGLEAVGCGINTQRRLLVVSTTQLPLTFSKIVLSLNPDPL